MKDYKLVEYYSKEQVNGGMKQAVEKGWQVETIKRDASGYYVLYSRAYDMTAFLQTVL